MSIDVRCGDPEALTGYLYDECSPDEREAMERHLARCSACEDEIASLRSTREQLAEWTPPDALLGFRIVSPAIESAPEATAARRWWQWSPAPAWAQAMAAVFLFACGVVVAAMMNLEVRYDNAGMTVRTGWQQQASTSAGVAQGTGGVVPVSSSDLQALESRLHDEMAHMQVDRTAATEPATASVSTERTAGSNDLLQRVRELVSASEQRQQRELALRLSQVIRDVDSQRRADILRIERTVGPMEGVTTEEIQQQRQMLNYLLRVSQTSQTPR